MTEEEYIIYWDTSAILSVLFYDKNSETAQSWLKKGENNLISTLAYAETCAVIGRIKREGALDDLQIQDALNLVKQEPWRRINFQPEWKTISYLSNKWVLQGAGLWHLVTAKTL